MGLRSPNVPFSEMDQRQSDQYARNVPVVPDANSVGEDILKDGSVTEPKFAGGAVSTRALADKAVTPEKISDANALTLFGRLLNTNGTRSDLAFPTDGQFAVRRGTQITADTLQDADIPSSIARDTEVTAAANAAQAAAIASAAASLATHVADADPHTGYQKESERNAASGYAGLNASSRTTKGVDTTDDIVIDLATKGLVLKDTQGTPHYWRVTINTSGVLVTTDLGTTKP
jgi:hypothetical protein